uniref:Membrane cofactor protein n=2 Tax=Rousettus aegyptiacus TaxID=9407 RepID=A0A7J8BC93_ROUAE|nr:hypothetical protein HJG63_002466 [Rousettus aegyptiacus]
MTASAALRPAPHRLLGSPFDSWSFLGILLMALVLLLPTSSDACDVLPRYESMMLKGVSKDNYLPGEQIEFKCRPGYTPIIPALSTSAVCQPDNTWTPLQEACTGKLCQQLDDPVNGQVAYVNGSYKFGSQAHYICNEGFFLLGTKILYCELSGNTVDWSDTPPQCEKILCQPPGTITNGKYTNSHKDVFEYNEVVTYSCNPSQGPDEYSLIGEPRLICSGKNRWSGNPPECKVVKCPYPVVQNGIQVSGFGRKYNYNAMVRFECVQGFQLKGSDTIVCGVNSTWEPAIPQCVKGANPVPTKPPVSSDPGANTSVPNRPPASNYPDNGLIAVIVLTVVAGIVLVGTCVYKFLHIRNR